MLITNEPTNIDSILRLYGDDLRLESYPIWNEDRRAWLNERIIEHFRYRTVSAETSTQFIFFLNRQMTERMPAINPIFEVLEQTDEQKSWANTYMTKDTITASSSTTADASSVFSDTPQVKLYTNVGEDYATNINSQESTTANTNASTSDHTGTNGIISTVLSEWLAGVNNALLLVFASLEPLFCQDWDL